MAFTPRSAKNAKVRFGAVVLTAKKWTVTPKAGKLDVTNAESAGFGVYIGGIADCDVVIEFDLDGANNNYDIANIHPGNVNASDVKLYLNDVAGPFWEFPNFFIEQMPNVGAVRESVNGTLTGCGSGTFNYPTGAF